MTDVDVVIPTFNRRETIAESLRSVLAQTRSPKSIIVVDDGSTDGTAELIQVPVKLLQQSNSGVGAARNAGVRAGNAKWIAFLDSDDLWAPSFLERVVDRAEKTGADLAYCLVGIIDEAGRSLPGRIGEMPLPRPLGQLLSARTLATPSSAVVRRSSFEAIGGFETDRNVDASADWVLWTRLCARGSISWVDETLAFHRTHSANMMSNPDRMRRSMERAAQLIWTDPIVLREARGATLASTEARIHLLDAINAYTAGGMSRSRRSLLLSSRASRGSILREPIWWWTFLRSLLGRRLSSSLRAAKNALHRGSQ